MLDELELAGYRRGEEGRGADLELSPNIFIIGNADRSPGGRKEQPLLTVTLLSETGRSDSPAELQTVLSYSSNLNDCSHSSFGVYSLRLTPMAWPVLFM